MTRDLSPRGSCSARWGTDRPIVDPHHRLSAVVRAALREARDRVLTMHDTLAFAVRAVLEADPDMKVGEAYQLVNRLWVR